MVPVFMIIWNQTSFNVHVIIMIVKVLADKILQEAFFKISLFVKYMREYIYIYYLIFVVQLQWLVLLLQIIINRFLSCHCVLSIDQSSRIFVWVWCHRNLYIDQLFPEMIAIIHSVKYSICQPTGRWCLPSLCGKMVWVLRLWIFAVMLLIHH